MWSVQHIEMRLILQRTDFLFLRFSAYYYVEKQAREETADLLKTTFIISLNRVHFTQQIFLTHRRICQPYSHVAVFAAAELQYTCNT